MRACDVCVVKREATKELETPARKFDVCSAHHKALTEAMILAVSVVTERVGMETFQLHVDKTLAINKLDIEEG